MGDRSREWEPDAFEAFYHRNVQFVYGIALSYVKNREDAEDITADLFLQVYERGNQFTDEGHARAWLTTAVRNRCRNHLLSWRNRRRADPEILETLPDSTDRSELKEVLAAVYRLPERYRLPLLLFAVEGYSLKETAQMLRLNESTLRTRIARAREMIRKETEVTEA